MSRFLMEIALRQNLTSLLKFNGDDKSAKSTLQHDEFHFEFVSGHLEKCFNDVNSLVFNVFL